VKAAEVMVVGQAARDPVVVVDALPGPSGAAHIHDQRELSGGMGANQAVGLAQLGVRVGLLAVVGEDRWSTRPVPATRSPAP
jgi:ribokinase